MRERPDQYRPFDEPTVRGWFVEALRRSDCTAWLAILDGSVAGYLLTFVQSRAATPFTPARTWLELDQIGVDPALRRRGVGTALLSHSVLAARAGGHPQLELTTLGFNLGAQALFRKLGFSVKSMRLELSSHSELAPASD